MGIDDSTREIVGTTFDPLIQKVKGRELSSWLRNMLSDNAVFEFIECHVDGKRTIILKVGASSGYPVSFRSREYIRDGSYTKLLVERPQLASVLWSSLNSSLMEMAPAMEDCTEDDIIKTLSTETIVSLLRMPPSLNDGSLLDAFVDNGILLRQDYGMFSITNAGALLFAKDLTDFGLLSRRALRIVRYNGDSKVEIGRQYQDDRGYAVGFESNVHMIMMMLPSKEVLHSGRAVLSEDFSEAVIRELLTNAMVHQDLSVTGMNLAVEVFSNRVEISNPGTMLIAEDRLMDSAPRPRNNRMASLMKRMGFAEGMGSGWDKIVDTSEENRTTVPKVETNPNGTRIIIKGPTRIEDLLSGDLVWNCYMHACSRYMKGAVMTVQTLGRRFDTDDSERISKVIEYTADSELVKEDSLSSKGFVPYWA